MPNELNQKQKKYLSNTTWYHATTEEHIHSINKGVKADINRDFSQDLDFGYGFYLTDGADKAERYISKLLEYDNRAGIPVILEFTFDPLPWFSEDEYNTAIFGKPDQEFGLFVFENRSKNVNGEFQHNYDSIFGVMSDTLPLILMTEYRAGTLTQEEVILKLITNVGSIKQLSLHNQELCDKLKISRAYSFDIKNPENRKELDLNDYQI
jgi:hypothetical protein